MEAGSPPLSDYFELTRCVALREPELTSELLSLSSSVAVISDAASESVSSSSELESRRALMRLSIPTSFAVRFTDMARLFGGRGLGCGKKLQGRVGGVGY